MNIKSYEVLFGMLEEMQMTPEQLSAFITQAVAVVVANDDGDDTALTREVNKLSAMMKN